MHAEPEQKLPALQSASVAQLVRHPVVPQTYAPQSFVGSWPTGVAPHVPGVRLQLWQAPVHAEVQQ